MDHIAVWLPFFPIPFLSLSQLPTIPLSLPLLVALKKKKVYLAYFQAHNTLLGIFSALHKSRVASIELINYLF